MANPVPPPLPTRGPPPLPAGLQPPRLPWELPGEYDTTARTYRRHGRETSFLPSGDVFDVWIAVNSTWLNRISFHQYGSEKGNAKPTGVMHIEFVSGAVCRYDNFPANDFLDLATSSSKGRYVYYQLKQRHYPYVLERGPTRSAGQIRALVAARQPKNAYQRQRYYNVGGKRNAGGGTPSHGPMIG